MVAGSMLLKVIADLRKIADGLKDLMFRAAQGEMVEALNELSKRGRTRSTAGGGRSARDRLHPLGGSHPTRGDWSRSGEDDAAAPLAAAEVSPSRNRAPRLPPP